MTLRYPDALMIQGSIGAPPDHHHQDEGTTDGVSLMVNKVNYLKECSHTTPTCLLKHDMQERHHNFYELEAPDHHHHTYKHLILGLNHLNGRTPITPRSMYLHQHMDPECYHPTFMHHQYMDPECYHPTFMHHQYVDPECYHPTLMLLIHHFNEEFLVHNHPAVYSL